MSEVTANSGKNSGGVANLKPFKPGQSGNPSGRPKGSASFSRTIRDMCNGKLDQEAAEDLYSMAKNEKQGRDRLSAWRLLLEYAYGKAPAYAAIEGHDPLGLSDLDSEIQAIADELSKRRAA